MRRTVNIWWVIVVAACVVAVFFWYTNQLSETINELRTVVEQEQNSLTALQAENAELEALLKVAGTDAFIEDRAREKGFMMPDEIRFVITGTEAEYIPEGTEVPAP